MTEFTAADRRWMRRALTLARRGWGRTAPNPMVGAVIVRDGVVVGGGWHAEFGAPHAEVVALTAAGENARGATLYVTLEPCAHVGQTPPCVPAIVTAGVSRVVFAVADPNPVAAGGTVALRAGGVIVESGLSADEARELNAAFHHRFSSDRPFVTLKLAVSIDGAIGGADRGGWLTGDAAKRLVHRMRAGHDAIAVGSGTVLSDDPRLTVRMGRRPRVAPTRVVFDRRGRTPLGSKLVSTARRVPTLLLTGHPPLGDLRALVSRGVHVEGVTSLVDGLRLLKAQNLNSLLVEGGAVMAAALLDEGLVDRMVILRAPVLLGAGALPAFGFARADAVASAPRWRIVDQEMLGEDEMTVYAPQP